MASTRRMGPDGIGIKKMDVDGVSSKRSAVDEDDVEGHASRRSAPDGVNRRADADGLTSSKRSAVDEDDVEGHMIGAMLAKLDVDRIEYSYSYRYMYEGYYSYGGARDEEETPRLEQEGASHESVKPTSRWRNSAAHFYRRHVRPLLERSWPVLRNR